MKNLQIIIVIVLLSLFTTSAKAATVIEFGDKTVTSLRYGLDGLYVEFNPALVNCGGGTQYRMHAKVSNTAVNYKELSSALLAAYTTSGVFRYLWVANAGICSGTHILDLQLVEFSPK